MTFYYRHARRLSYHTSIAAHIRDVSILMQPTYSTSYTLLERAKDQNDCQAWEELINNYRKYIYVVIRSMNVNHSDSDDILQQVLVELWKYLPKYERKDEKIKFRVWLAKITRNQVISFVRKQKSHLKKCEGAKHELEYLDSIETPEIDRIIDQEWKLFLTNAAMEKVETHFSAPALEAFRLFRQGQSPIEIASKIGVKPDSVYKYISRIKLKLFQEIQDLKKELDF
ncbi:RNA polymerase sigma factor [Rubritalea tangerina]|uniref:RNA polymerase sigma factor SigS n=2 Tax=Rubritalea tangerina TaxID=430798 RepID=A0ABW4Z8V6_9BACT